MRRHWMRVLLEGVILVILGWLALFLPIFAASATLDRIIGWLFVVCGLVGLVITAGRHAPGSWWSLLSAILAMAVGATLIQWPAANSVPVAYLLAIFFIIEGIATILHALHHKRQLSGRWEWMVASGIIALAVSALVVLGLPETAPWAIGLLVGINLVFGGAAMIANAIYAHSALLSDS